MWQLAGVWRRRKPREIAARWLLGLLWLISEVLWNDSAHWVTRLTLAAWIIPKLRWDNSAHYKRLIYAWSSCELRRLPLELRRQLWALDQELYRLAQEACRLARGDCRWSLLPKKLCRLTSELGCRRSLLPKELRREQRAHDVEQGSSLRASAPHQPSIATVGRPGQDG